MSRADRSWHYTCVVQTRPGIQCLDPLSKQRQLMECCNNSPESESMECMLPVHALTPAGRLSQSCSSNHVLCSIDETGHQRALYLGPMIDGCCSSGNSDLTLRHLGTSSQPKIHVTIAPSPTCSKATNMPSTASQPMPCEASQPSTTCIKDKERGTYLHKRPTWSPPRHRISLLASPVSKTFPSPTSLLQTAPLPRRLASPQPSPPAQS